MICYRDKTFCDGDGCAKFNSCPRALTEMDRAKAKAMSRELPCWTDQPIEKDENPSLL